MKKETKRKLLRGLGWAFFYLLVGCAGYLNLSAAFLCWIAQDVYYKLDKGKDRG